MFPRKRSKQCNPKKREDKQTHTHGPLPLVGISKRTQDLSISRIIIARHRLGPWAVHQLEPGPLLCIVDCKGLQWPLCTPTKIGFMLHTGDLSCKHYFIKFATSWFSTMFVKLPFATFPFIFIKYIDAHLRKFAAYTIRLRHKRLWFELQLVTIDCNVRFLHKRIDEILRVSSSSLQNTFDSQFFF